MTPEKIQAEAKRAVDAAFKESGGPAALHEAKLRPVALVPGAAPGHREDALKLLTILAPDAKRLRQDLLRVGEVSSGVNKTAGRLPPHRPERAELPHSVRQT